MLHCKSFSNCQRVFRASFFGFFFLIFNLLFVNPLSAQKKGGNFGVGFQVGKTIGLNLHSRGAKPFRFDLLVGVDLGPDSDHNSFIIDMHGHWFIPFRSNPSFNFYLGPGAFIGLRGNGNMDDIAVDLTGGVSGNFGINYEFSRFDVFLQLTPRLYFVADEDERTGAMAEFNVGGGLGMRVFF